MLEPLIIDYVNWKNKRGMRKVMPIAMVFKSSPYHNDGKPTWIMEAIDLEKGGEPRDFEMTSILNSYLL